MSMTYYLSGGFAPIPYEGFKKLRAEADSSFTSWEDENSVILTTVSKNGSRILCLIDKVNDPASYADYLTTMHPFANAPVEKRAVFFNSHDWSDKRTWNSRTTGNCVKWVTDGLTGCVYDDIAYQWKDAQGNVLATLDESVFPAVWKDAQGNPIVQYVPSGFDPKEGVWQRVSDSVDVTDSAFRINPDPGYKVVIQKTIITAAITAVLEGVFHYRMFGFGYPFPLIDWPYGSLRDFRKGSNEKPFMDPGVMQGNSQALMTFLYNYQTDPVVLDSRAAMSLELSVDNNQRVTATDEATATFYAMKVRSF